MAENQNSPASSAETAVRGRETPIDLARERQAYTQALEEIQKKVFGKPEDSATNEKIRHWERLEQNIKYRETRDRVKFIIEQTAERLWRAVAERAEKKKAVLENTRRELAALHGYIRTVGTLAQTVKLQETPYGMPGDGAVASGRDTLEINELVMLEVMADRMRNLDTGSLTSMILEDQAMITMLAEESQINGLPVAHYLPKTADGADLQMAEQDIGFFKLDPQNPNYWKNIDQLRRFISKKGVTAPEKQRAVTEVSLWTEIVRNLDYEKKRDLVAAFAINGSPEQAVDFIHASILAKTMTKEEAMKIYQDEFHYEKRFEKAAALLGENFEKGLDNAVARGKDAAADMQGRAEMISESYIDNAANHYITFNNLIMGRLTELGILTVGMNLAFDIADALRRREERHQTRTEAVFHGIKDAAKNPRFWFGVGEFAVGSNFIFPWAHSLLLRPTASGEEQQLREKSAKTIQDEFGAHFGLAEFFEERFDALHDIARRNESKKGSFGLAAAEVPIAEQEAKKLGYQSAREAQEKIAVMFRLCTDVFRIKTRAELETVVLRKTHQV